MDGLGVKLDTESPVNAFAATVSATAPPLFAAALEDGRAEEGLIVSVGEDGPDRIAWARSWMLVVEAAKRGFRVEERMKLAMDDGGLP